jgi:hypothetical protein
MQNTVHLPLSRRDTAYMGGQVASRRGIGGGTLLFGVKRQCSAVSSLEASASVGLRGAASIAGNRALSEHANGGMSLTWSPRDGALLRVPAGFPVLRPRGKTMLPARIAHARLVHVC